MLTVELMKRRKGTNGNMKTITKRSLDATKAVTYLEKSTINRIKNITKKIRRKG